MGEGSAGQWRVGINGFGRMGRLLARRLLDDPRFELVRCNDPAMTPQSAALLLARDSIQGPWNGSVTASDDAVVAQASNGATQRFIVHATADPGAVPWQGLDLVFECSGRFRTHASLQPHLDAGAARILCSAPTRDPERIVDLVFGVNHDRLDPTVPIVTAASCTTNCIAAPIAVVHREFGIRHGALNTIHAFTLTQRLLDDHHADPRRSRAAGESLIPTSTGSATAIGRIFPELAGRLDGLAIRVPMPGPSLTDLVLELDRTVTADAVNAALRQAAAGSLAGVLGVSDEPLVSIDYRGDPRSGIVDALSTSVQGGTQLRLLVWYDNEWGYVCRMRDLAAYWLDRLAVA